MGIFARIKKAWYDSIIWETIDEDFYDELEESLIMADLGAAVAADAVKELRKVVYEKSIQRGDDVKQALRDILEKKLKVGDTSLDLSTTPSVVLIIGVNGVGKTTSIGKLASRYKKQGKRVLLCAADTFRAAAADQLEIWADRAGVEIVRSREGADPGAVLFDSLAAAKARNVDVVFCDTAGRLHNKANLMQELAKLRKIIDRETPDAAKETLLVLDATTGQNGLQQAKVFRETAGLTGIILTKLDGTAKGGICVAIAQELGVPVKFVGLGEGIDDLQPFDAKEYVNALEKRGRYSMKLVLATQNPKKLKEMNEILSHLGVEVVSEAELGARIEVEETGETFTDNARLKATAVMQATGLPAVADDSGLCVDALNGGPGVYSARFGGEGLDDKGRYTLLLEMLRGQTDRAAHFHTSIVCAFPNGDELVCEGECPGTIAFAPMGEGGFGYDPVFFVPELRKTFGQLTAEEKASVSHRGKALRAFAAALDDYLKGNK